MNPMSPLLKTISSIIESNPVNGISPDEIPQVTIPSPVEDPLIMITIGGLIAIISGLTFSQLLQNKVNDWKDREISPLPLLNIKTASSWFSIFFGATLFFTGILRLIDYSAIKSLLVSGLIAIISAVTMWRVIKDLIVQIKSGEIKEIDEYF